MKTTDWLDDGTGFRCNDCGGEEAYAPANGFFLLAWYAAGEAFDQQHRACRDQARSTGPTVAAGTGEA